MNQSDPMARSILFKGAGEKASAVAHRLYQAGMTRILMTDLPLPRAERRGVCFCEAILEGQKEVQGVKARMSDLSMASFHDIWRRKEIPVVADPETTALGLLEPEILIDALMAKENRGTTLRDAPLVVALGPGFIAGKDAHFVVETHPAGRFLGGVIWEGQAEKNTGLPDSVAGLTLERLILSPVEGEFHAFRQIGDTVRGKDPIGQVGDFLIQAPIPGVIWGLVRNGVWVAQGQKIGDIDPRGRRETSFEFAPQAKSIAEGVLQGILRHYRSYNGCFQSKAHHHRHCRTRGPWEDQPGPVSHGH